MTKSQTKNTMFKFTPFNIYSALTATLLQVSTSQATAEYNNLPIVLVCKKPVLILEDIK